jgi:hypothetical protein
LRTYRGHFWHQRGSGGRCFLKSLRKRIVTAITRLIKRKTVAREFCPAWVTENSNESLRLLKVIKTY